MSGIKITLKQEFDGYSVVKAPTTIEKVSELPLGLIPSCSVWFDPNSVSEIEKSALPEYFTGKYPSKTPDVYMRHRNFILQLYRDNPTSYLDATTCRRQITGDACAVIRLHAFLEHWGLINFKCPQMGAKGEPHAIGRVLSKKRKVWDMGRPKCTFCDEICGFIWYKFECVTLCSTCYEKGNYPEAAGEFKRTDLLEHLDYSRTEDDVNLLEALDLYGEDWVKISGALSRPIDDCMSRFLELPLKDLVLNTTPRLKVSSVLNSDDPTLQLEDISIPRAINRAQQLVNIEDRTINSILNKMLEVQVKKIELKTQYFSEVEHILQLQAKNYQNQLQQQLSQEKYLKSKMNTD